MRKEMIRLIELAVLLAVVSCSRAPTPALSPSAIPSEPAGAQPTASATLAQQAKAMALPPTTVPPIQPSPTVSPGLTPVAPPASAQPTGIPTTAATGPPAPFSIAIRIDGPDILQFWNQYARVNDVATGWSPNASYVAQSRAGLKALTYGQLQETQATINLAKQFGIHTIIFNREKTQDCAVLVGEQGEAYRLAQQQGVTFVFEPTGVMLRKCIDRYPEIVKDADVIAYQTEEIQVKDRDYANSVKTMIHRMRTLKPGLPVWVQVSVNPPGDRAATAPEVIGVIRALEDSSPDSPDVVQVFYYSEQREAGRSDVMEQVIREFRGAA